MTVTLRKFVLYTVAAIVVAPIALYLLAIFINRNDEPPSALAADFAHTAHAAPTVPDRENGFVFLLGFGTVRDDDPLRAGRAQIAAEQARRAGAPALAQQANTRPLASTEDALLKSLSSLCRMADAKCVAALEKADGLKARLAEQAWVIDRYMALLSYPRWEEPLAPDISAQMPQFSPVLDGQLLLLLKAWTLAGEGKAHEVARLLESDLTFWRGAIAQCDTLISKMIAGTAVHRNLVWSNIILRRLGPGAGEAAIPALWHKPVTAAERSMLRPMIGEWVFLGSALMNLEEAQVFADTEGAKFASRLSIPLLQVQATRNIQAGHFAAFAESMAADYPAIPELVRRHRFGMENRTRIDEAFTLRNPTGMLLLSFGGDYSNYAARLADMEGVRRVTLLAAQLRLRGVREPDIRKALAEAPLKNPYDGSPFGWDEKKRALTFVGIADGRWGEVAILY